MINKIDSIGSYNVTSLEKIINIRIKDNLLDNKRFQNFLNSISDDLNSINPETLEKIYKEKNIKICRHFISKNGELEIDMNTIDFKYINKEGNHDRFFKYSPFKSNIISTIERQANIKYKLKEKMKKLDKNLNSYKDDRYNYFEQIEQIDEYIDNLNSNIENDLELITKVESIKRLHNKEKDYDEIVVKNNGKKYKLNINETLNKDEFNGKYSRILEIIDGNYVVNALTETEAPIVEYCAYVEIDQVYGLEGKWGLVDIDGNEIIKPKYVYPFIECGDNLQVMLPHKYKTINGIKKIISLKHGLIDKKGKVIIPIKYLEMNSMDNSGTYFSVLDPVTYKNGILDKNNNIIVPFDYEYIASPDLEQCEQTEYCTIYPDNLYQVKVCKNDLYGIYDLKLGKEIIKPKYKYMKIIGYNQFLIGDNYEHCNTLINEKEKIIKKVSD